MSGSVEATHDTISNLLNVPVKHVRRTLLIHHWGSAVTLSCSLDCIQISGNFCNVSTTNNPNPQIHIRCPRMLAIRQRGV